MSLRSTLAFNRNDYHESTWGKQEGVEGGRRMRLSLPPPLSGLSTICGSLDVAQTGESPGPVKQLLLFHVHTVASEPARIFVRV
jgi:hypothetical protein